MGIEEQFSELAESLGAELKQKKKGRYALTWVVAKRKSFLSSKKLTYRAKFQVDAKKQELSFSESLAETGGGLSAGSGGGFETETYKTGKGGREGKLREQSVLLGKKYQVDFDWQMVRNRVREIAEANGLAFK